MKPRILINKHTEYLIDGLIVFSYLRYRVENWKRKEAEELNYPGRVSEEGAFCGVTNKSQIRSEFRERVKATKPGSRVFDTLVSL